jgi:hypothetical protein
MRIFVFVAVLLLLSASGGFLRSQAEAPDPLEPAPVVPLTPPAAALSDVPPFTFAAAGDHGANDDTDASLAALNRSGASFYLALGDNDYDQIESDEAWCDYVTGSLLALGPGFPFQVVAGNHEEQGGPNGYIMDHAACMPDRMASTGVYGAEYHFDYPQATPLMRVIMISPDLRVEDEDYSYESGSDHYRWLADAIDGSRTRGIPWVAVGMHKNCITAGEKECEIGEDLLNLLVGRRVDLVFQGHDHTYQRSKQLASGPGCRELQADEFEPRCVSDDGADGSYARGAGTVIVISGSFGRCCYEIEQDDPELEYFAATDDTSTGFTVVKVGADRIEAEFVASTGEFEDRFVIAGSQ